MLVSGRVSLTACILHHILQGQCGSCWAFSTAETVESQRVLAGFAPIDLSPQQIAAYTPGMYGCGGGDPIPAYDYIMNKKGANNPVQGLATGWFDARLPHPDPPTLTLASLRIGIAPIRSRCLRRATVSKTHTNTNTHRVTNTYPWGKKY